MSPSRARLAKKTQIPRTMAATALLIAAGCQPSSPSSPSLPSSPTGPQSSESPIGQDAPTSQPEQPLPLPPVPPPAQVASVRVPEQGCFQDSRAPGVVAAQSAAAKSNEAAYQAALQRQGLTKLSLGSEVVELHRGVRGEPNRNVPPPAANMIPGPKVWSGSPRSPERWEFVQTQSGSVYRVRRVGQMARIKEIVLCGCQQKQCGPYGSGCPACGATTQTLYGPLPAGATYEGELQIPFHSETVRVRHEQGTCQPQRACTAPPSSMPGRR